MAAELPLDSIFDPKLFGAAKILTTEMEGYLITLQKGIDLAKQFSSGQDALPNSIPKIKAPLDQVNDSMKVFNQLQNQIVTAEQKNNTENIKLAATLKTIKDQVSQNVQAQVQANTTINAASASLVQLEANLKNNRIAYANLAGEQARASAAGKSLLANIQQNDTAIKEIRGSLGQFNGSVGDYANQIQKALGTFSPTLGSASEAVVSFGEKLSKINPIFAAIAAGVAIAGAGISQFFTKTAAGEEQLKETTSAFGAIWHNILEDLGEAAQFNFGWIIKGATNAAAALNENAAVGQQIAKEQHELALEKIKEIEEGSAAQAKADKLLFDARDAENKSLKERLDAVKEGDQEILVLDQAKIDIARKNLDLAKQDIANQQRGQPLLIEQKQRIAELTAAYNQADAAYEHGARRRQSLIANLTKTIYDIQINGALAVQKSQIDINNDDIKADQDKNNAILADITSNEASRKTAIIKNASDERAIIANNQILALAQARKDAVDRYNASNGVNSLVGLSSGAVDNVLSFDEQYQLEKTAIAKNGSVERSAIDLKEHTDIIANQINFLKKYLDNEVKAQAAIIDADSAAAKEQISNNNLILKNVNSTYDQRAEAITNNAELENQIAANAREKQKDGDIEAAQIRIASGENATQVIKGLWAQLTKADADYNAAVVANNNKAKEDLIQNPYTVLQNSLKQLQDQQTLIKSQQESALDNSVKSGDVGIFGYDKEKEELNFQSQVSLAQKTADLYQSMYEKILASGTATETQLTEARSKSAQAQAQVDDLEATRRINNEKKVFQASVSLANETLDAAKTAYGQQAEAKITDLQAQSDAIAKAAAAEVQVIQDTAGSDVDSQYAAKEQIATINNRAAEQEAALSRQSLAIKQKEAEFNKKVDEAKAITNTAVAVTEALASAPPPFDIALAAIAAAAGAVQIALIASTPIPKYEVGTMYSKQGFAVINEKGPELVIDGKTNQPTLYDTPGARLTWLNEGSKVFTADQTERLRMGEMGDALNPLRVTSHQSVSENYEIVHELKSVTKAVKGIKLKNESLTRNGAVIYRTIEESDKRRQSIRDYSLGKKF